MAGFIYNGSSTKNILSTELILVSNQGGIYSSGQITRNLEEGDPSITRPIVNEYGTITEHIEFSYSLAKITFEPFTAEEQIAVERWLTSPKFSQELIIYDCDDNQPYKYFGKFTQTEWEFDNRGYIMLDFVFHVNGSYAYQQHREEPVWSFTEEPAAADNVVVKAKQYNIVEVGHGDPGNRDIQNFTDGKYYLDADDLIIYTSNSSNPSLWTSIQLDSSPSTNKDYYVYYKGNNVYLHYKYEGGNFVNINDGYFNFYCYSDELEEYVYPTIKVNESGDFKLTQVTDNNKQMVITTSLSGQLVFDCRNCIVSKDNTHIIYQDIGWNTIDNIYWMRLIPGNNRIKVEGNVNNLIIEYDSPLKVAGGWLV